MRNYFTFGTVDSRNFGVTVSGLKKFAIQPKTYEFKEVPGRLGDVVLGGKRTENVTIEYPCFISPPYGKYNNLREAFYALKNALLSENGYVKLVDSYDTGHYMMAAFEGDIDSEVYGNYEAMDFNLSFNCKPQRFLNGQTAELITSGTPLSIATLGKRGYPIFTLTGAGSFDFLVDGVVQETVTVSNTFSNGIIIDCERKVCYDKIDPTASGNLYVQFSNYQFPEINKFGSPKATTIGIDSTGLNGQVVIKWFEL